MQSKISFFNKTVIRKNITRFWPLWAVYLFVWFLIMPYGLIISVDNVDTVGRAVSMSNHIIGLCDSAVPIMAFIYSIMTAMVVFSYMQSAKSVSLYHSMPVRREGLFLSSYISGLIFSFGPHLITAAITCIVGAVMGNSLIMPVLTWLYMIICVSVLFFSVGAICATFTGHIVIQPVLYVIVNFLVIVVELVVRSIGSLLLFGVEISGDTVLGVLSPMYELLVYPVTNYAYVPEMDIGVITMENWALPGIYLAAGVVIAAAAVLIYRRRRSEAAGDVVAVKCLKPVFKYCLSFGMAITVGLVLFSVFTTQNGSTLVTGEFAALIIWMLIAAAVGYIAGEMLIRKSLHVFTKRTFGGIGIVFVAIIAVMGITRADVFGIENRIPDGADIQSALINSTGYFYDAEVNDPADLEDVLALHSMILANKDEIMASDSNPTFVYNDEGQFVEQDYFAIRIYYTLKNGNTLLRCYYGVPVTEDMEKDVSTVPGKYLAMCNEPEQILRRIDLGENYDITYAAINGSNTSFHMDFDQAQLVYEAMKKDAMQGNIGRVWAISGREHNDNYYVDHVSIDTEVQNDDGTRTYYGIYLDITKDSVNTLAAMKKIGYDVDALETISGSNYYYDESYTYTYTGDEVMPAMEVVESFN